MPPTITSATASAAAFARQIAGWFFGRLLLFAVRNGLNLAVFVLRLDEIGDVKEGIALETDLDERRLHAGEHARHFAFVDGAREGVFVLALKVNLR